MADLVERIVEINRRVWDEWPVGIDAGNVEEVRRAAATAVLAALEAEERRGLEPTEDMIEAAAKAIHDHWQNGPGPHARTWAKCCRDLPAAAADFRAKARVGLVAALVHEARVRERWQPIETAPKDGREVLITDGDAVGAGFYDDAPMAHRADAGWFWEDDRANLLIAKNAGATHWMPLPAPPKDNREPE